MVASLTTASNIKHTLAATDIIQLSPSPLLTSASSKIKDHFSFLTKKRRAKKMLFIFSLFRSHYVSLAFQYELHNFRHKFKTLIDLLKQVKKYHIFSELNPPCVLYIFTS